MKTDTTNSSQVQQGPPRQVQPPKIDHQANMMNLARAHVQQQDAFAQQMNLARNSMGKADDYDPDSNVYVANLPRYLSLALLNSF